MKINGITDIARFLTDEAAAQDALANLRWPNGVTCPLCEGGKKVYEVSYKNVAKDGTETVRKQWKCGACRKKFSVTSRSIFEGAHIPVGKWIYAIFLMCSSKKGVSANQLSRELDISYKSAWFMCHRVREAMLQEPLAGMLGTGPDAIVELDETYVGGKKKAFVYFANRGAADMTAACSYHAPSCAKPQPQYHSRLSARSLARLPSALYGRSDFSTALVMS